MTIKLDRAKNFFAIEIPVKYPGGKMTRIDPNFINFNIFNDQGKEVEKIKIRQEEQLAEVLKDEEKIKNRREDQLAEVLKDDSKETESEKHLKAPKKVADHEYDLDIEVRTQEKEVPWGRSFSCMGTCATRCSCTCTCTCQTVCGTCSCAFC